MTDESQRKVAELAWKVAERIAGDGKVASLTSAEVLARYVVELTTPRPIDEWHEDMGNVLWWRLPVGEPPYCGARHDGDWIEDYYTHWTPPPVPFGPEGKA